MCLILVTLTYYVFIYFFCFLWGVLLVGRRLRKLYICLYLAGAAYFLFLSLCEVSLQEKSKYNFFFARLSGNSWFN